MTDPELQKTVAEAVAIEEGAGVGSRVRVPENVTQQQLGRIAAQTAGQVYRQRLREAERDVVYHQYVSREGEILTGVVTRTTESAVVLDMSRGVEAVLSVSEQLPGEHYRIGQHLKVFVLEVRRTTRGPVLVVSRTHRGFLRRLMEMEIPEIYNGSVVIRGIAREAGSRSKVAVESRQPGVDAKGAAVGQRGTRIQAIVAELNGEKVDVVLWNEDAAQFVAEALSPAEVIEVRIDEEHRIANVIVPERQLSLAIGREGQNARLAAKLTGWRIDIRSDAGVAAAGAGGTRSTRIATDDGAEACGGRRCRNAGLITSRSARVRSAARCAPSARCSGSSAWRMARRCSTPVDACPDAAPTSAPIRPARRIPVARRPLPARSASR